MIYTDIREVKSILQIEPDDTSEDKIVNFYIEWASALIEEFCNRDFTLKLRTEFYNGTGTQKLILRQRPVFTSPQIIVIFDSNGFYGSSSGSFNPGTQALVYGKDFCLQIDQPDGTSKNGILVRINDYWYKPGARQQGLLSPFIASDFGSFQITYLAGYTVDSLPSAFRVAADLLVARMRYVFPLGVELTSESYEDRSISIQANQRDYMLNLVKPILFNYRNWVF